MGMGPSEMPTQGSKSLTPRPFSMLSETWGRSSPLEPALPQVVANGYTSARARWLAIHPNRSVTLMTAAPEDSVTDMSSRPPKVDPGRAGSNMPSRFNTDSSAVFSTIDPAPPLVARSESLAEKQHPGELNLCEACENHQTDVWYCNICELSYCDLCWQRQITHKKARAGALHEKTSVKVAQTVQKVLSPPTDNLAREQLYRADEVTSWFGIERRGDNGPPVFQDYGRFAALMGSAGNIRRQSSFLDMEQWTEVSRDRRTPSLVSFVGQTGAGKSSLIKLLIDFGVKGSKAYPTPVVGPRGAHLPTSEDVHLYSDPRTCSSPGPLLFADCEGLEGGEREPLGAKFKRIRQSVKDLHNDNESEPRSTKKAKVVTERELKWADTFRKRGREFTVTHLYPRLLYTFSDVIVFVLRNPRTIELIFEKLVKWAEAAIETSSNQPVLPHVVIALNATECGIEQGLWDVKCNTEMILDDLADTVFHNETFKRLAQFWRERGKNIDSLEHLILCYYSSIQVIRMPTDARPKLMAEQVEKLYGGIFSACVSARVARNDVRMLLDVEDMHAYLQEAFNHYARTLATPFDFVQASYRNSPIPPDFGGNILKLAISMARLLKGEEKMHGSLVFEELSSMVASCIMLDTSRHKNKGIADKIFPEYMNHLDDALENFCDQHWPCEFRSPKTGVRCVNVRSGHSSKGHQSADGKVFATGEYESKFSFQSYTRMFHDQVYAELVKLLHLLTSRCRDGQTEERAAAEIHQKNVMDNFFHHNNTKRTKLHAALTSHTACFCCLFGQAEHFLPCGHVICTRCLRSYGEPFKIHAVEVSGCPMKRFDAESAYDHTFYLKPSAAGIRVLSLDGGGIRGIVELETLLQLEDALGGIPIQYFFDLVVGTSTGGLVALGLGAKQWSVEECIEQFIKLCKAVFTRRNGAAIPIIGSVIENFHHSKYQTSTMESAFREAYGKDELLFGGERDHGFTFPLKVAVTTTNVAGSKTYVLANYNQPRTSKASTLYSFQRPESSEMELKVWEAARATSAAPRYFKSFHHGPSHKTYIDGAVMHNNPVRIANSERKLLWPEILQPDVFLSLGTGSHMSVNRTDSEYLTEERKGVVAHGRKLYHILMNNMQQNLDCERTWDDFSNSAFPTPSLTPHDSSTYQRLNPDVGPVPELDNTGELHTLHEKAKASLKLNGRRLQNIAMQLIASTFYFEIGVKQSGGRAGNGRIPVEGRINCRLLQPSEEVLDLGNHLKYRAQFRNEEPRFEVREEGKATPLVTVPLTPRVLERMTMDKLFDLPTLRFQISNRTMPTHIVLCFGEAGTHPISGFPRKLFAEHDSPDQGGQAALPDALASTRYKHRSVRLRRSSHTWKPPTHDLKTAKTISDLRQYAAQQGGAGGDWAAAQAGSVPGDPEVPVRVRTTSPTLHPGDGPPPRGVGAVREAFRALWLPYRASRPEPDLHRTPQQGHLSPDLEDWLAANRHVPAIVSEPGKSPAPDDPAAAPSQLYNVRPEEYAKYRNWVHKLQPEAVDEQ